MSVNQKNGKIGEQEVVDLVSCPNCGKKLMLLPDNYPFMIFSVLDATSEPKLK